VHIHSKHNAPRSFKASYKQEGNVNASKSVAKLENTALTLKFAKVASESRKTLLTIN
jgi:HSP20 family molecular chaperone IbpA